MNISTTSRRVPHPWQFIYSLRETQEMGGPSPNRTRELISQKQLEGRKIDGKWFVIGDSLRSYLLGPDRAVGHGGMEKLVLNVVANMNEHRKWKRPTERTGGH